MDAEGAEECCLLTCFFLPVLVCFLIPHRTACPGLAPPQPAEPSHIIINQESAPRYMSIHVRVMEAVPHSLYYFKCGGLHKNGPHKFTYLLILTVT